MWLIVTLLLLIGLWADIPNELMAALILGAAIVIHLDKHRKENDETQGQEQASPYETAIAVRRLEAAGYKPYLEEGCPEVVWWGKIHKTWQGTDQDIFISVARTDQHGTYEDVRLMDPQRLVAV